MTRTIFELQNDATTWLGRFLAFAGYAALIACTQEARLPITGEIRLEYVRTADSGTYFRLVNQSNNNIEFRGEMKKSIGAYPWDHQIECREPDSNDWIPGTFALVDGGRHIVEVERGEQIDVVVDREIVPQLFRELYKGGRCRLSLMLTDDSKLKSTEFEMPPLSIESTQ